MSVFDSTGAPETITLTDLEFIFLGNTKLSHTLREEDTFEDLGTYFRLTWTDVGEEALVYKFQLLQFGRRTRTIAKDEYNAVDQMVKEIQAKENREQGITVKSPAPATAQRTGGGAVGPLNPVGRNRVEW